MELDFPHRHIFNTTLVTAAGSGSEPSRPVYRITTTLNWLFFPQRTTIEFIASEREGDRRLVATIIWNWLSQRKSYGHVGGHLYTLSESLGCGKGFFNTDSYIIFDNETYVWRMSQFGLHLLDFQGRRLAWYRRDLRGNRKGNSISGLGHLRIENEIASNPMARDAIFTSFFIFKTSRGVHIPWRKQNAGLLSGVPGAVMGREEKAEKVEKNMKTRFANDGNWNHSTLLASKA